MTAAENRGKPRFRRPGGALLLVSSVVAVTGGLLVGWKWRSWVKPRLLASRIDALRSEVVGRSGERPTLIRDPVEGNAWELYLPALRSIASEFGVIAGLFDKFSSGKAAGEDRRAALDLAERLREELAAIREGARRTRAIQPIDWSAGVDAEGVHLSNARVAARLLAVRALLRLEAGEISDAVDDIETACQLGFDCQHNGTLLSWLVGQSVLQIALTPATRLIADSAGTAEYLIRVGRLLDALESHPATLKDALLADALQLGRSIQMNENDPRWAGRFVETVETVSETGLKVAPEKRANTRLMFAELWLTYEAHLHKYDECAALPWPEAERQITSSRPFAADDPMLEWMSQLWVPVAITSRRSRAQIRLLRAGVSERLGDGRPIPLDPFSLVQLRRKDAGDEVVYWSIGPDGDQGGLGEWNAEFTRQNDLVLRLAK
jgi:hypothetical protein